MKIPALAVAAAVAIGMIGTAPATAQTHRTVVTKRTVVVHRTNVVRRTHANNGRHNGWHHRRQVCTNVWRHHRHVRTCTWRRW